MERIRVNMHRHRLSDLKGEHLNVGVVARMFSSDASVEFYSSQCRSEMNTLQFCSGRSLFESVAWPAKARQAIHWRFGKLQALRSRCSSRKLFGVARVP